MTKLQKILFVIVACLSVCMMTICFSLYRAIYVDPNEVVIQYKMIKDKKIPDEMKDVSIAYFTDLEYGAFENKGRVDRLFKKLNDLHADIFIFGGDLLAENYTVSDETKADMIARLSAIDAPLGKFAVLGEQDLINEERLQQVNDIYHQAQFEVLNNTNRLITNRSSQGIELIGLYPDPNMEQALTGIGDQTYNLLVSHYADPFLDDSLKGHSIALGIAGNSHGTQIMYPIYGGYRKWPGNEKLNRADGAKLSFPYMISSGTGCIKVNARLNSKPEIIYLVFSR